MAVTPTTIGGSPTTSTRSTVTVTSVLFAGTSALSGVSYIADPGTYTLRADVSASDGSCVGSNSLVWAPWLTYVLLGTSQ